MTKYNHNGENVCEGVRGEWPGEATVRVPERGGEPHVSLLIHVGPTLLTGLYRIRIHPEDPVFKKVMKAAGF